MYKKSKSGFTLAELLLAIAIMVILFGIGFVAVSAYLKNLRLNEMDWTAKEIFIASQNQLSKAKENGTLQAYLEKYKETKETGTADHDDEKLAYITFTEFNNVTGPEVTGPEAWAMLMPFGAIDETVRLGGSYIIQFAPASATVTRVYYSNNYKLQTSDYGTLNSMIVTDESGNKQISRDERKRYGDGKGIIGFYDGTFETLDFNVLDDKPKLEVENANKLVAHLSGIKDDNRKVLLCIKGLSSNATGTINVSRMNMSMGVDFTLDGVTSVADHFANVMTNANTKRVGNFIPGENIELFFTVMTSESGKLSNVLESNHVITNSLFASSSETEVTIDGSTVHGTAVQISNIRHLENLDKEISGIKYGENGENDEINVLKAEQVEDFTWPEFRDDPSIQNKQILTLDGKKFSGTYNSNANYYPVNNLPAVFTYEGNNRYIGGVTVGITSTGFTDNVGLFGTVSNALTVNDLELRNFNLFVNQAFSETNAGALVGSSSGTLTITNVIAYNTLPQKTVAARTAEAVLEIRAGNSAGGLVGNAASATITGSAAAVYVRGRTAAGGLVGNLGGGLVTDSYVGGHTNNGQFVFPPDAGAADGLPGRPNVWATSTGGHAGGFAGTVGTVSFTNCYTTASAYVQSSPQATSGTANLFIGTSETVPEGSYAAGWTYKDGKVVYPDLWMTDFVDNTTMESQTSEYNYDPFWDNDYYPYKLIQNTDVWFLKTHVGDWALPGELVDVIN